MYEQTGEALTESEISDREIVATRIFNAPRDLVFRMWIDPKHVAEWWGPTGFTITIHEMDVRPGGVWRLTLHGPDGVDYPNRIVYVEIERPMRLIYRHEPGKGDEPVSFLSTVTFSENEDKTEVHVRMVFPSVASRDHVVTKYGAIEGLYQHLARLEEKLAQEVRQRA